MCMVDLVIALLMVFLKNSLMCLKKVKLLSHNCLPILMLLYIMLFIMFAYSMLLAAYLMLFVCIMLFFLFFAIDFLKCFLFSCFVLVY